MLRGSLLTIITSFGIAQTYAAFFAPFPCVLHLSLRELCPYRLCAALLFVLLGSEAISIDLSRGGRHESQGTRNTYRTGRVCKLYGFCTDIRTGE